ncbi:NHL repeat-containing protein [Sporichthya brevicatena]|uniref:NHL repeat-containing protein n=1 Tax=Sporichthya brevicatena TaxID=171442 RepID=A0ABN1GNB3_9ACTN
MRVQIIPDGGQASPVWAGRAPSGPAASSLGWRPYVELGASSPGALRLPDARATATGMYGPRGVCLHDGGVIVADTGNHRVLIFRSVPDSPEAPADVILGQPDATSEAPNAGGRPEIGMRMPTGVLVTTDGRLVVADAWNHRLLVWDGVPDSPRPADLILGQASPDAIDENRGGEPDATTFYWPFGIAEIAGRFFVTDTGNRRVLIWRAGLPASAQVPADVVLGQPDAVSRDENRGTGTGPDTFRWPHAVARFGDGIFVADAGNHRLLGWRAIPEQDRPADVVVGQPDMVTADDFPYRPQSATSMRFPYAVTNVGAGIAVADTANNRVLLWESPPTGPDAGADGVLGQVTFSGNGENRWEAVTSDTLCWPYGIACDGSRLAIADSGNNRVVIWAQP